MHVWTVNEEAEMSELLDMGVDGLISDYPHRALEVVRSRASASADRSFLFGAVFVTIPPAVQQSAQERKL